MRKTTNKLQNINTVVNETDQTPIEIALQIDKDGMTTASNLYAFLELNSSNFTKWCKRNIENNSFAVENEDYFRFVIEYERNNPKPRTDYRLTSDFAKKLSMTGNTKRHEQARQYFIACEQGLKIATQKIQNNINEDKLVSAIDNMNTTLSSINTRLSALEEQSNKKKLPEKKYSRWKTNTFNKLNTLLSYVNTHSDETLKLSEIIHLVITETEDIYGIEVNDYVDAYKSEFELDTNPYAMDVINHYKDIRDMFSLTLDSIMEKLGIAEKNINHTKNIFDELALNVKKNTEKEEINKETEHETKETT
jgi:phage anti-repressor protein